MRERLVVVLALLCSLSVLSSCGKDGRGADLPSLEIKELHLDLLELYSRASLSGTPTTPAVQVTEAHPEAPPRAGELFVNVKKVAVKKGGNRPALLASPPSRVAFRVTAPAGGVLELGLGLGLKTLDKVKGPVSFLVQVDGKELYRHTFPAPRPGGPAPDWIDARIDLGLDAEREVRIELVTEAEGAPLQAPPLVAGWSQPRIVTTRKIAGQRSSREHPNVLFVVIDTLRADHMGVYGYARPTTPSIDRWSRDGLVFTRAISLSSWTWPATATLLSGLYPYTHGVTKAESCYLPEAVRTAGEMLQESGLRSFGVSANPLICLAQNFGQGFEDLVEVFHERAEVVSEQALRFLDEMGDERFFLYLHYMDPHYPYDPPMEDLAPFRGERTTPEDDALYRDIASAEDQIKLQKFRDRRDHLADLYDGEIRHCDAQLARIFAELKRRGLDERTIVVLTSDHGEELFDHGRVGHARTLHGEVLHVPLILRFPGEIAPSRSDTLVETIDVLPTLLSLAGVKADPEIQGRPLPLGRSKARGLAFATTEMGHPGGHGLYLNQNSVQDEMWKLIYEPATGAARLYDLGSDPGEMRPLVSDPGEVVPRLLAALKQWMLETSALRVHTLGDVSDATRRKLEELGYVDVADPENKGKDPGAAEKRTPEDLTWDGETFTPPVLKEANGG